MENVLVVDDESSIAQLSKRVLEQNGLSVSIASGARQALEMMAREPFSVVLTDLSMPGMTGQELLKAVKDSYPRTSVIVVTGQATLESAIETLKNGAFDYLVKPFNIDELSATVMKCVEHARLQREESVLNDVVYLYQFSQKITSFQSENMILEFILHRVARSLTADAGSVFTFIPDTEKLTPMAVYGTNNPIKNDIKFGEGIAGWVAKNAQPVLIQDGFINTPQFKNLPVRSEIASSIVAPLMNQDTLIGVMCINRFVNKTNQQFGPQDLESLKIFAVHAALILSSLRHKQALDELNKLKSEFVSNVSHELRTPLMSIGGALELLADYTAPYAADTKVSTFLAVISRNAKRMHNLVNDLLDFARIETKKMILRYDTFKIKEVILEAVQDLHDRAGQKNVKLDAEGLPDDMEVNADRERIMQILVNLIDNAIKFTPEGGWVKIRCGIQEEKYAEIIVSDSGIGISDDKHGKIFQEFYQVDGSASRKQPGFGLGLAIVKSIVDEHKGKIWVESEPGKGASFFVRMPLSKDSSK